MTWSTKGTGGLLSAVLCVVYKQRVLIALQKMHVASILKHTIVVNEHFSKIITLLGFLSFSFFHMLLAINGGFGT
jgi:hypothetical protein